MRPQFALIPVVVSKHWRHPLQIQSHNADATTSVHNQMMSAIQIRGSHHSDDLYRGYDIID